MVPLFSVPAILTSFWAIALQRLCMTNRLLWAEDMIILPLHVEGKTTRTMHHAVLWIMCGITAIGSVSVQDKVDTTN